MKLPATKTERKAKPEPEPDPEGVGLLESLVGRGFRLRQRVRQGGPRRNMDHPPGIIEYLQTCRKHAHLPFPSLA